MQSHTGCTCLFLSTVHFPTFLHKNLIQRRHSHIGCICLAFHHCVFSNVSSNGLHVKLHIGIGCTCLTSFLGHFLSLSQELLCYLLSSQSSQDFCPSQWGTSDREGKEWTGLLSTLLFSGYWLFQIQIGYGFEFEKWKLDSSLWKQNCHQLNTPSFAPWDF